MTWISRVLLTAAVIASGSAHRAHASSVAGCDTATARERTLGAALHIAALHVDIGGGSAAWRDTTRSMSEARLALGFCRWPSWTVSWVGRAYSRSRTLYESPGSSGYHPYLYTEMSGIGLEHRWKDDAMVHPMAAAEYGSLRTNYSYSRTVGGVWEHFSEESSSTSYASLAVGAEVKMFRYMRADLLLGERRTGELRTAGLDGRAASGMFLVLALGFGKFN